MNTVTYNNKTFKISITTDEIISAVERIADQMNLELLDKNPLFICILNGAFVFAADLLRKLNFNCEVEFVKIASYNGLESTGEVKEIFGLDKPIENRTIVIIDDIVDTGATLIRFTEKLKLQNPLNIKIAAIFYKPNAHKFDINIDYKGLPVDDSFVVGYGMDYNGMGRNLKDLYSLTK